MAKITSATFMSETVLFIRDDLRSNISDPISRSNREKFVVTAYPKRNTLYPIITIRNSGPAAPGGRLGMQSEGMKLIVPLEVRVWARNEKERDNLSEQVFARLRLNQFGSGDTSTSKDLHDFSWLSSVPIDEEGEAGIKSMVMEFAYLFVANGG